MSRRSGQAEALSLLGLAQRAGALARGGEATRRAIRKGEARLVVLARDASETQLEKILKSHGGRPLDRGYVSTRAALGAALGSGPLSAVAVTKASFADPVSRALRAGGESVAGPTSV